MRRWAWIVVAVAGAAVALAQSGGRDADSLPVATSLLAGFVTHTEGDVVVDGERVDEEAGKLYQIEDGERAVTRDGRAEFTLCIGSYLRLAENSELEMVNAGMWSAEVRLVRGELLADVPFLVDEQVSTVHAGRLMLRMPRAGLYRIQAEGDAVRVDVLRGRGEFQWEGGQTKVGKGKSVAFAAGAEPEWGKAEAAKKTEMMAWNRKRQKAWQDKSKESWDEMSPLERMMLDMTMRRPTPRPPTYDGGNRGGASPPAGSRTQ